VLTNDEIRVSARAGNQEIKDATTDNIASTVHNRTQLPAPLYTTVHTVRNRRFGLLSALRAHKKSAIRTRSTVGNVVGA
jgi:hypothetical protein